MIKIEDITEEQKDFLYEIIVDTKFEVFLINKHIENVNSEFKDKFGIDLNFSFDEELGEYYIGVGNYTQWRKSDLIIIDVVDNIPDEVKAYFNKN